jgi:hypothetical protein
MSTKDFEDSGRQYPISFWEKVGIAVGMVLALLSLAGFFLVARAYLG